MHSQQSESAIARTGEEVVRRFRQLYAQGAVNLFEGNISARAGEVILMTPSQQDKEALTPAMLVHLSADGTVLKPGRGTAGEELAPSSEYRMHLELYRLRPDAGAVVHTHSPFATAFALAGLPVTGELPELMLQFGGEFPCAPYGRPGTDEVFTTFPRHFGEEHRDAVLLANHGLVCVGGDVTQAFARAEAAEKLAKTVWLARALGSESPLPAGEAEALLARWAGARPNTERR